MIKKIGIALILVLAVVFSLSLTVGAGIQRADAGELTFAWDANTEANLMGYRLYSSTTAGGPYVQVGNNASDMDITLDKLADPVNPLYVFTAYNGVENEKTYFVLTAFDDCGLESGYSTEVAVCFNENPPTAPMNFTLSQ